MHQRLEETVEQWKRLLWDEGGKEEGKEEAGREQADLQGEAEKEALGQLREEGFIARRLEEYAAWPSREAFRRFVRHVGRKRRMHRRLWGSAAAVAACLIGTLLLMQREDGTPAFPPTPDTPEIIAPGSARATLRLADGKTVQVAGDSMQIAGHAGNRITYEGGQLTYRTENKVTELVYNELEVPAGGECDIVLEDGTQVWLNAASKLKYPVQFVGGERRVSLRGEAYFKVAKGTRPFIVATERGEIRVLGTSFNVRAYTGDDAMATTLVEGKVRISDKQAHLELAPGEQGIVTATGRMEKRPVDIDEYIGWRKGVYVFRKQTLGNIMKDLERWYNVSVFFRNAELEAVTFTGNLKRYDNINAFLELLQRTGDIHYNISNHTVIIYK